MERRTGCACVCACIRVLVCSACTDACFVMRGGCMRGRASSAERCRDVACLCCASCALTTRRLACMCCARRWRCTGACRIPRPTRRGWRRWRRSASKPSACCVCGCEEPTRAQCVLCGAFCEGRQSPMCAVCGCVEQVPQRPQACCVQAAKSLGPTGALRALLKSLQGFFSRGTLSPRDPTPQRPFLPPNGFHSLQGLSFSALNAQPPRPNALCPWYTYLVHLCPWYTYLVHLAGTPTWYTCAPGTPVPLVHLPGTPTWYT